MLFMDEKCMEIMVIKIETSVINLFYLLLDLH